MSSQFWSEAEVAFLTECALAGISADSIAPLLGRSPAAVRMKRLKLNLAPPSGPSIQFRCGSGRTTVAEIKRVVASHFGVPVESMTSPARTRPLARPRQVAMFFAREVGRKSYPHIGSLFGGRDHSTVIHAVRTVERRMAEEHDFKDELWTLKSELISAKSSAAVDKCGAGLVCPAMVGA